MGPPLRRDVFFCSSQSSNYGSNSGRLTLSGASQYKTRDADVSPNRFISLAQPTPQILERSRRLHHGRLFRCTLHQMTASSATQSLSRKSIFVNGERRAWMAIASFYSRRNDRRNTAVPTLSSSRVGRGIQAMTDCRWREGKGAANGNCPRQPLLSSWQNSGSSTVLFASIRVH
jgi:hypothetical protein